MDSSSSRATPEAARNPAIGEIAAAEVGLCTVCDLVYLPRLLVMERSLRRVWPSQRLHVVCLDEATRQLLDARDGIVAIAVDEVERSDPAVADTRPFRSRRAYAWTLKPSVCLHVLGITRDANAVVFVDADLRFFSSAAPILNELGRGSIVLVPGRAVPPGAWTAAGVREELGSAHGETWGYYSSGMVAFRRNHDGLGALRWWRERCIESCQERGAPGPRGDQWYLNALPESFGGVRVVDHPGVGLAPYNARGTRLERRDGQLLADGGAVVFYHHNSLRLRRDTARTRLTRWCSNDLGALPGSHPALRATVARHWRMSSTERELFWLPYRQELAVVVSEIVQDEPAWAETIGMTPFGELAADVASELRWRGYQAAGRVLPPSARRAASWLRALPRRLRNRRSAVIR